MWSYDNMTYVWHIDTSTSTFTTLLTTKQIYNFYKQNNIFTDNIYVNQLKLYIIKITTNKYQIKKTINILTNNHYNIKSLNNKIIILSQYQLNNITKLLNTNYIKYKITQ